MFNQYLRKNLLVDEGFETPPSQWDLAETKVMQWMQLLLKIKGKSLAKARNCQSIISGVLWNGRGAESVGFEPDEQRPLSARAAKAAGEKRHVDTVNLLHLFNAIDTGLSRQSSKDAVTLVMMTGTRLLAGLGLRWDQIDIERGFYFVEPKQPGWKGFTGILPLSDFVLELLKTRLARRGPNDGGYPF